MTFHWAAVFGVPAPSGAPDVNPKTAWTRDLVGTPTATLLGDLIHIHGAATNDKLLFIDSESTNVNFGGICNYDGVGSTFYCIMKMGSGSGIQSLTEVGVRIDSSFIAGGPSDRVSLILRIAHNSLVLYDNNSAITKWSFVGAADQFTEEHEIRIVLSYNSTTNTPYATVMWKRVSDPHGAWSFGTKESLSKVSSGTNNQIVYFGQLDQNAVHPTIDSYWREVGVLKGDAKYADGASANPDALIGMVATLDPAYVAGGRSVVWGGSGGNKGDSYTAGLDYAHGAESIFHPSPRIYWEGATNGGQQIILDAGEDKVWQVSDIALIGINSRFWVLDFDDDPGFLSATGTRYIYADMFVLTAKPEVVSFTGATMQWTQPASQEIIIDGALNGKTIAFTSGALNGKSYKVKKDLGNNRVHLDTGGPTLAALGLIAGDKFLVFGDMAISPVNEPDTLHRYLRLRPSTTTTPLLVPPRLGSVVIGTSMEIRVPLDWEQTDSEQPNITTYSSRSAVQWTYIEGPPQRTFVGRMVGDALRNREEFRSRLRWLAQYSHRPVVLVLDDSDYAPDMPGVPIVTAPKGLGTAIYGRITSGSQQDDSAWYIDSANGVQVNRKAGDLSLVIVEEV